MLYCGSAGCTCMYLMALWLMVPRMRFSRCLSLRKKNCNALTLSCASVRVVQIEWLWFEPSCFWGSPCLLRDTILLRIMQVKTLSACCLSSSNIWSHFVFLAWIVRCIINCHGSMT